MAPQTGSNAKKRSGRAAEGLPSQPWGRCELSARSPVTAAIGPRVLWIRLRDGEVWISHSGDDPRAPGSGSGAAPPPPPPDDEKWERWATADPVTQVELLPALPSRSVVLQPERTFRLTRGAGARVYVRVPLWIRVRIPGKTSVVLQEVASLTMSDTWWGDPLGGELAYWLPTTARRQMRSDLFFPHLAVCPLQLWNRSEEDLRVEKVLLKVEHLSIFEEGPGRFWTDSSTVRYQGETEESVVEKSGNPPREAPGARLVTGPRVAAPKGFRAWSFDRLRAFSGL